MNALPVIALGAAAAAEAQTRPKRLTASVDPLQQELAQELVGMPCGVDELSEVDAGTGGRTFLGRHDVQRESLISHFGETLPFVRIPVLSPSCLVEYCQAWIDIQEQAAQRSSLLKAGNGPIGRALPRLKGALALSLLANEQSAPLFSRTVHTATQRMAAALDSEFTRPTQGGPSGGEILDEAASNVGEAIGGALAFGIETIAAPVVGAGIAATAGVVFSAIGPYLLVGGAIVYLGRKS